MAITTRPSNATKCVVKPVLDAKQCRRMKAQIEADKRVAEEEKKKIKQKELQGIEQIAAIQVNEALTVVKAQTKPPKPRPRPLPQRKRLQPGVSVSEDVEMVDAEVDKDIGEKVLDKQDGNTEDQSQKTKKKKNTPHCDAINAICALSHARASDADRKGNLLKSDCTSPVSNEDDKDAFLGHMQKWASNIGKPKSTSISKSRASRNSKPFSSNRTSNTKITMILKSTAATSVYPPSTCVDALDSDDKLEEPGFLLGTDDTEEQKSTLARNKTVSDIITISDGATEDNSFVNYSLPPFTQTSVKREASDSLINVPPPSKRSWTKASQKELSESKIKYNNEHLPNGCQRDNKWRGVLISTYAKWNRALQVGWGTKNIEECKVLKLIWDAVYKGKVPASIESDGPVHFVASQRMTKWWGGIASVSIGMITSLVASDKAYSTEDGCSQLGKFWLEDNCFLFANISADDKQDFTRMWKSPFILQTFAAHLHYILGAIEIPTLDGDNSQHPGAALALAAVAVKHAFMLLAENSITFEIIESFGKGKKKANSQENQWKASVREAFSKERWGHDTDRLLKATKHIPEEVWDDIIAEACQFIKDSGCKWRSADADESSVDDDLADDEDEEEDEYTDLFIYW
ncbi:hypothetical protein CY34DRAFT_17484 [Suillus luteus UH-Slu-Lm8-n1]|uniref:Uncharacterized protein n=1 Tax=Suillus luteus UH-Slu-Lm8-n1 TaxID=930992 RepID=A0A0D0A9D4_9AGAM|nr:hypothetical protein CY34DRAFT_17484 [Suillus luteus UH-Slu-Lm8-n1]